ncbi:MAG: hypothetical protein HRT69_17045 [Flavobacteriaceae bacterium]|nr:hypothetical protein [Flavobacteriaceae bacterium]
MTKQNVIEFIQHDRSFTGAKNLYNKLPGKSLSAQNSFNRIGDTPDNLRTIIYEICKLVDINDRQFTIYMSKPLVIKVIALDTKKEDQEPEFNKVKALLEYSPETFDYKQLVALVKQLGLETKNQKEVNLRPAVDNAKADVIAKQIAAIPTEVKPAIKLRVQFPFLREADCPDALKILVADLITSYDTYADKHEELFKQITQEQLSEIAATVVENYISNKLAFAELEYYKTQKIVLGEHPIFEELKWQSGIQKLNAADLSVLVTGLTNKLNRNKAKLKKATEDEDIQRSKDLVDEQNAKLKFAKQLLAKK